MVRCNSDAGQPNFASRKMALPKMMTKAQQQGTPYKRKKKKLSSFFQAVKSYLTSDSFMYGPLLEKPRAPAGSVSPPPPAPSPPPPPPAAGAAPPAPSLPPAKNMFGYGNGLAESLSPIETPGRASSSSRDATHVQSPPASITSGHLPDFPSSITKRIMYGFSTSYKPRVASATGDAKQSVEDAVQTPVAKLLHVDLANSFASNEDDATLTDQDDDSRSFTESQAHEFTPLHSKVANEVAQRLVKKIGGRYSKELGIYVDIRDSEVERWFLATTCLTHASDFEMLKQTFKKLHSMGISKIQDVLSADQRDLEELFESTTQRQRVISRLQKLATSLHENHSGSVCSLKRVADYTELRRELLNLPGYSRHAVHLFLRELRGVWPGAVPEVEARARNAAKHLHLVPAGSNGPETTTLINDLAQEAGLDVRDLEAALIKLGLQHSRQYRSCSGGVLCGLVL